MKIYYVANVRIPTEKAHGLAIVKMCEALSRRGASVELVIPRRTNRIKQNLFEYYSVVANFTVVRLPTLDLVSWGRVGFLIQSATFAFSTLIYGLSKKDGLFYGRDEVILYLLSLFKACVVWEAHSAKSGWHVNGLLRRLKLLVVVSAGLKNYHMSLGVSSGSILVARSGVDLEIFDKIRESKTELRRELNLPIGKKILAYVGRTETMGREKGVEEIRRAFQLIFRKYPDTHLVVVSGEPLAQVPRYMKAADILVMNYPNTLHYSKHMSPLKMFEYMASGNAIVSSDLPSIREVLDENTALFFKPDREVDLIEALGKVLTDEEFADKLGKRCRSRVGQYSWDKRADAIINRLQYGVN